MGICYKVTKKSQFKLSLKITSSEMESTNEELRVWKENLKKFNLKNLGKLFPVYL